MWELELDRPILQLCANLQVPIKLSLPDFFRHRICRTFVVKFHQCTNGEVFHQKSPADMMTKHVSKILQAWLATTTNSVSILSWPRVRVSVRVRTLSGQVSGARVGNATSHPCPRQCPRPHHGQTAAGFTPVRRRRSGAIDRLQASQVSHTCNGQGASCELLMNVCVYLCARVYVCACVRACVRACSMSKKKLNI